MSKTHDLNTCGRQCLKKNKIENTALLTSPVSRSIDGLTMIGRGRLDRRPDLVGARCSVCLLCVPPRRYKEFPTLFMIFNPDR